MDKLDLFYEMKTLDNISSKAKEMYFELQSRILLDTSANNNIKKILLLFPTISESNREYKKCVSKADFKRVSENEVLSINENRIFLFMSIEELHRNKLIGHRINQIRFIG